MYLLSQSTLRDPEQLTQLFTAFRAFAAAENSRYGEARKRKQIYLSKMNVDNPGELMEVLLENREARKFLGDFIEDAISKSHVSVSFTCSVLFFKTIYQIKFAITYFVVTLSSVCRTIKSCSNSK